MDLVAKLAIVEIGLLVGGFFAVVLYQIAVGKISLSGLLNSKEADGRSTFSPARLQLLIFTVVVAAQYVNESVAHPHPQSLPSIPLSVVIALGGSQAAYLGGKAVSAYIQPLLRNPR